MKIVFISILFYFFQLTAISQPGEFEPQKGLYGLEDLKKIPGDPDYKDIKYWIAHPITDDMADVVPGKGQLTNDQVNAEVDVFFVYPTIYNDEQNPVFPWFADVNDTELNDEIAISTIKYQASVFNGSARIYSPLYRQAHISVFLADSTLKVPALNLAYQDVKKAFEYYLENWNNDRPIIIAGHSQGTLHAARLLKEYFEGKPLMDRLVAAYIIGMPIRKDYFSELPICESPDQTTCWMSWNTYLVDFYPKSHKTWFNNAVSVNPLNWSTNETWESRDENTGGLLRNFKKIKPRLTDAKNHDGMLWIHKPHFFGNFLLSWNRFHIMDYNLFYLNIRENVDLRVKMFLDQNNKY